MVILCNTQYYNKIEIRKYKNMNILMYVSIIIFMYKPYLLKGIILVSHKSWALRRNKCENVHYWKNQKS